MILLLIAFSYRELYVLLTWFYTFMEKVHPDKLRELEFMIVLIMIDKAATIVMCCFQMLLVIHHCIGVFITMCKRQLTATLFYIICSQSRRAQSITRHVEAVILLRCLLSLFLSGH